MLRLEKLLTEYDVNFKVKALLNSVALLMFRIL